MKIPNIFHFIFGLHRDFGKTPFSFIHYLSIRSVYEINRPDNIFFYYKYEPRGKWWQASKKMVTLVPIEPPTEIFGKPLLHFAHKADVLRIEVLMKYGGVYLDMDVICLKPFKELFNYDFVMGVESEEGLCNAVMLSRPDSEFLKIWYEEYRSFRSKGRDVYWNEHSVKLPLRLAKENPDLIHIEGVKSFFYPHWKNPEILWKNSSQDFSQSYCIHLWESKWWGKYLKRLSPFRLRWAKHNFSKLYKQIFL